MANITSIGGNPIVPTAVQLNSVTDPMLVQTGGVLGTALFDGSYNNHLVLEQGLYAVEDGEKVNSGDVYARYVRSAGYVPIKYSFSSLPRGNYRMTVAAYDASGTYVGMWTGDTFSKTWDQQKSMHYVVDLSELSAAYPDYSFKMNFLNSGTALTPADIPTYFESRLVESQYNDAIEDFMLSTRLGYELGYYAIADGNKVEANHWARTPWFVSKTLIVSVSAAYFIILVAYDADGTYIGVWNGSEFVKVYGDPIKLAEVNIAEVAALHPDYGFKLDFSLRAGGDVDLEDLAESVTVGDAVFASHEQVPRYYADHMEAKNAAIRENIDSVGINGETFLFITDIHWENNHKNSPALVKSVLDNTNVRLMLCGGDIINTKEKAEAIAQLQEVVKAFDFPTYPMHMAFGNHDANSLNWSTTELREQNQLSTNEAFGLLQKNTSFANNYVSDTSIDYYFDRQDSKTRFVFLDSGTSGAYASGVIPDLCEMLSGTPSGYRIVIVQHWYLNGVTSDLATLTTSAITLMNVVKEYNDRGSYTYDGTTYSFASAAGEVVLLLGGHTHYDYVIDVDDSRNVAGVPLVCTSDDSYRDRTATAGTVLEQCFDVITLDYTNRTIKCVRVGDGQNRTVEF